MISEMKVLQRVGALREEKLRSSEAKVVKHVNYTLTINIQSGFAFKSCSDRSSGHETKKSYH